MISDKKLDFWIKQNLNVLMTGEHGVGKTSIVKAAFERNHLKWKYFSAATMDPWVDFVGIPKEQKDENGESYLDLVRPKDFRDDDIEALFFDEYNRCLTGDTKIALLSDESVAIRDLVGRDHFFVYSFDAATSKIAVGKGHSARITAKHAKILKITIDNGAVIRCTEDHPFLMFDKTYRAAKDLREHDSLMPLYRIWPTGSGAKDDYEHVWQPKKNSKWEPTYYLADEFNIKNGVYKPIQYGHRHHKNFEKWNNSPENIVQITEQEHRQIHSTDHEYKSMLAKRNHEIHPDLYARTIGTPESKKKALAHSIETRSTSEEYKQLRSTISKAMYTPEVREYRSQVTTKQWENGQFNKINRAAAMRKNHISRTMNILNLCLDDSQTLTEELYLHLRKENSKQGYALLKVETIALWFGDFEAFVKIYNDWRQQSKTLINHKVLTVEEAGYDDVYDITVDEYHNFALEGGVFVHNSPKKVKNAVMELIQFKSINGHKFKNLRVVWAAINPDDSVDAEYDVEKLDPAQRDRFHIHITIPFMPDKGYFSSIFGNQLATSAIEWWKELPQDKKILVSPRRLDYALQVWKANGDIRDVLPSSVSATGLLAVINGDTDFKTQLDKIVANQDVAAARELIKTNLNDITPIIAKVTKLWKFFMPLYPEEVAAKLASENLKISKFLFQNDAVLYKAGKRYRCGVCKKAYINWGSAGSHVRNFHLYAGVYPTVETIKGY